MTAGPGERRKGDRRHDDRRRRGGRRRDDHLFSGVDTLSSEPFFDPGWLAAGDRPRDGRLLLGHVRRIAAAQDSALARVFRTYAAARAALGVGLVLAQGASSLSGMRHDALIAVICLLYAAQAITLWLLPRFRPLAQAQPQGRGRRRQWLATIGVDLAAFTALHLLELGSSFNYAALLVLPVLMAGVLTSRLFALGTAAMVSLMLLGVALRSTAGDAAAAGLMLQSGLAGLGLFIITLLAGELAGRLAREEMAARGSLELARQQAQLNRLVIEEMVDGVLVVDRRLRVRAANPAARALLVDIGLAPTAPFGLGDRPAWAMLREGVERALAEGHWPEAGLDVVIAFAGGHTRTLRTRVRFMRERAPLPDDDGAGALPGEPLVVLLLEDVRTAMARARQEKLAAMGRVSAGIAHEIRNPLAAIAQANALMLEDELPAPQRRLARMVADNVERLKRIVDDVMEVAPGAATGDAAIDASACVATTVAEWASTRALGTGEGARLQLDVAPATPAVAFDHEHLRRVLVNLLDNAHRHASALPGGIRVELGASADGGVLLAVLSDGAPIAAEVERHLFEPFFSTRSRGSGLGLYICRELCERYGASIEYRGRPAGERLRNEFVVRMRPAVAAQRAAVLPVET